MPNNLLIGSKELILKQIFQLCQSNFEPASVIAATARRASELLKNDPSPEILPSTVFYSTPQNRQYLTNLAKNFLFIEPNPDSNALKAIFKVCCFRHIIAFHILNQLMLNRMFFALDSPLFKNVRYASLPCLLVEGNKFNYVESVTPSASDALSSLHALQQ